MLIEIVEQEIAIANFEATPSYVERLASVGDFYKECLDVGILSIGEVMKCQQVIETAKIRAVVEAK